MSFRIYLEDSVHKIYIIKCSENLTAEMSDVRKLSSKKTCMNIVLKGMREFPTHKVVN